MLNFNHNISDYMNIGFVFIFTILKYDFLSLFFSVHFGIFINIKEKRKVFVTAINLMFKACLLT